MDFQRKLKKRVVVKTTAMYYIPVVERKTTGQKAHNQPKDTTMTTINKTTIKTLNSAGDISASVAKVDGKVFTLNLESLTEDGLRYLVEYGLKQSLNDAVAGYKDGDTRQAELMVQAKLDSILAGTVGSGSGGSRDPLAKAIRATLEERVNGWKDFSPAAKRDTIAKIKAGNGNETAQAILAEAERRVASAGETAEAIDLGL